MFRMVDLSIVLCLNCYQRLPDYQRTYAIFVPDHQKHLPDYFSHQKIAQSKWWIDIIDPIIQHGGSFPGCCKRLPEGISFSNHDIPMFVDEILMKLTV